MVPAWPLAKIMGYGGGTSRVCAKTHGGPRGVPSCIYYKEMVDLAEEVIIPLVTFVLLMLSEILPFVTNVNGNGVLHTIVQVIAKIVTTSRHQITGIPPTAVQPTAVHPTVVPK